MENQVQFLGFRKGINNFKNLVNLGVFTSRQEGLLINNVEAIATVCHLVVTDCRVDRDLVTNNHNCYIVGNNDTEDFADLIGSIYFSE